MSDEGEHRVAVQRPYRAPSSATSLAVAVLAFIVIANSAEAEPMKIRLTLNGTALTATLIDSETTRDFISLLPLTLTMNDLFGREKFGHLPRAISEGEKRTRTYEVGDVIYWSPGPDVPIFYRHDGQPIPSPGIIVIGKIESGMEALNVPGSIRATVELS